jgi:hypothetical protein
MMTRERRRLALIVFVVTAFSSVALALPAASAFSSDDSLFPFAYKVNASTHLKKLNQTITVPPGSFSGAIDLDDSTLQGDIKLPPAKFTFKLAGIVGLVTATAKIVETKPVTGTVDFHAFPFPVVATATFNIRIVSAYAGIVPLNLVGNNCMTSTPVRVTMKTATTLSGPVAPFTGVYTIPPLKTCGAATTALNLVIPGPGNTFTATASPM